jgi:hypothetical protein
VNPHELLIAFPGSPAHCVTHAVVEPPVQVLPDTNVTGVVDEPASPVGYDLSELLPYVLAALAVDVTGIPPRSALYPLLADPVAVLTTIDRALVVSTPFDHTSSPFIILGRPPPGVC